MKLVTGKPALMRQINRNIIINILIKRGRVSRTYLANEMNVALPTVMRIVDDLLAEGLIEEAGKESCRLGRKPNLIELKKESQYFIGVEIAEESSILLADFGMDTIGSWNTKMKYYNNPEEMMEDIWFNIHQLVTQYAIPKERIAGVGIGIPGTNFKNNENLNHSIFRGWENFDVNRWVSQHSEYKVVMENVVRARTLGELWFGAGITYHNFLYIFVDQGVGCGIVADGKIFGGYNNVAGEFGHTIIQKDGKSCYCGNKGCIECYTSSEGILNQLRELGIIDANINTFDKLNTVVDRSEVQEIITQAGEIMGTGIANLINIFSPEAVILGGQVIKDSTLFTDKAKMVAWEHVFSKFERSIPIHVSTIDDERPAIGSIALLFNDLFEGVRL